MPRINAEYREDAQKKIIAAAIAIASESGWESVTMEAIARRIGVTKGALYAYFDNSEALLRMVILEVFSNVRAGLTRTLENSAAIHSMILGLADLIFEQQKPYATIFCQLPMRLPQDTQYRQEFTQIFDGNRIVIRDCLDRMKADGRVSADLDPEMISEAIIGMTMGLRITSLFLGKDSDNAKKVWIDSVERLLGAGPDRHT